MAIAPNPLDEVIASGGHDADKIHKAIVESNLFVELVKEAVKYAHESSPGSKGPSYQQQVRENIAKLLLNEVELDDHKRH